MSRGAFCVTCGADAPDASTSGNLTSRSGWRLTLRKVTGGADVAEWRCPACWRKHQTAARRMAEATTSVGAGEPGATR
ncbi:MAG: hypothetical protein ACRENE_19685 [Polyangiaceae bacterium]